MHEGGCLCGGISYCVSGEPNHVILCHCRFCQRATGGAYMVETLFDKDAFTLSKGEPAVYRHVSEGSGKEVLVHFCPNCGTKTHLTFERFPTSVGIYSGTFDAPDWFDRNPANTQYFFLEAAQNGTVLPAGYEVFHRHYWAGDGVPSTAQIFDSPTEVSDTLKRQSAIFAQKHDSTKS